MIDVDTSLLVLLSPQLPRGGGPARENSKINARFGQLF